MKWMTVFLSMPTLTLVSCQSGATHKNEKPLAMKTSQPTNKLPFKIDNVAAYMGGDFISVYITGVSDVIVATFDITDAVELDIKFQLGVSDANSITHFSGPSIVQAVLPAGAVPPLPADDEYTQKKAVSGVISCKNLPSDGFAIDNKPITFSFTDVTFDDGSVFDIEPMEIRLGVFPP